MNLKQDYDFSGWATRNNIRCSDGRTIMKDAFKHNDGEVVPLVWNHSHNDPGNVLGKVLLENREQGVYSYGKFNDTEAGRTAKNLVQHGDVTSLSIYANHLKQNRGDVLHGSIREVSLVLAGANPEAFIDTVMMHGVESEEEGVLYLNSENSIIMHGDKEDTDDEETVQDVFDTLTEKQKTVVYALIANALEEGTSKNSEMKHADEKKEEETDEMAEKTVQDVFDTLTEEQKTVVYALIGEALKEQGGNGEMKQNVFADDTYEDTLMHSEDIAEAIADAKRYGSMKDSFIAHGLDEEEMLMHANYGINNVDYLFPEANNLNVPPEFIKRDQGWVNKVMGGVHHTPFSRIKSMFADITADEARAKGYIKGKLKKDEVFGLLKRTTTPTTIYKKQKMDRDDVIDITDFDVIAWLKGEMRLMLDEEIARAILVGDGRSSGHDDKINESNIRPVWTDAELFTIKLLVPGAATDDADTKAKATIRAIIKARKNYKGSGNPSFYTTEDVLTDMLLLEDTTGRVIYDSIEKLCTTLRVKEIVTVPVMEGLHRTTTDYGESTEVDLIGLMVNMNDYNVGADKGGSVNMFDDFDIDYNQQKYLIETRCSGALTKPHSAIAVEIKQEA